MSRTLSAPRWGSGAAVAGILTLLLVALAASGLTARANAAFSLGKCEGGDVKANGASFASNAHNFIFKNEFKDSYCADTAFAGSLAPKLTEYNANGSGKGREAMMNRATESRFAGSDEPPLPEEIQRMNAGVLPPTNPADDPNPNDNGQIHVVPAAIGAIAPLVNFPNSCDVSQLTGGPTGERTEEENLDADGTPDDVMRVRFTREQFERMWAGDPDYDTWDEVFSSAGFTCNVPIIRVVRFDNSGSTFALKDYLDTQNASRGWKEDFVFGDNDTRDWPNAAEVGTRMDCPEVSGVRPVGPGADSNTPGDAGPDQLTSACTEGGGAAVDTLKAIDGSVGYADIATARGRQLDIEPEVAAPGDNDVYWTQLPDGGAGNGVFREPTSDAKGFRKEANAQKGANCAGATFTNDGAPLPSTLGNWANVSGVNSPGAFPTCTLTYGMLFDDNSDVWGTSEAEQKKARTVKDYWENVVTITTQQALPTRDYAPLPEAIRQIAAAGIAAVGWEKGPVGGGNDDGGGNNDGGGGNNNGGDGGGTSNPPAPLAPSNLFSLPKKTISSKTGGATVSVKIPGPGVVELVGTANVPSAKGKRSSKKAIQVGRTTLTASGAGTYNLALKPSNAAKQQLRSKGQLKVSLKVTYTPTGGTASTSTSSVTLKLAVKASGKGR